MKTTDHSNCTAATSTSPDTDSLRDIASVSPPPSAWPAAIVAHSLRAEVPRRHRLSRSLLWLWSQWEQWLPQPRLALAGVAGALIVAMSAGAGLWSNTETKWSTADNLNYFAGVISAADPYNLDDELTW